MSASSSAISTRCELAATVGESVGDPVIGAILAVAGQMSDRGSILYRERPRIAQVVPRPSYPNWQRKRIQNPSSVSSNLTEGTKTGRYTPGLTAAPRPGLGQAEPSLGEG